MTITKNIAAKLTVGFVALAMFASLAYAPQARAQSVVDLQAQITALLAQITALQAQLAGGGSSAVSCAFTRPLTIGSQGADVTCLQTYLQSTGHFTFAGGATGYFGPITQSAVAAWQAANGVVPAVGYFGPISQAKYSVLIAAMPAPPSDDDDDGAPGSGSVTLRGEASLRTFEANDGDDTSLEEGQTNAPVAEFDVEFRNGDARITRLDVSFVAQNTNDEDEPWDTFDEVSLWVDGDRIARMNADDEDDYLDEDDGSLRFSNLNIIAEEDETVTIVVAVSLQNSIDGVADGEEWTVYVDSMRFVDGDGVTVTENNTDDLNGQGNGAGIDFDIDEEGSNDELIVKSSSQDPDATTLQVERNEKSDWYTVFAFDLDTDDSVNDIELNNILVQVDLSSSTYNAIVSDAMLVIDGDEFDDFTVSGGNTATATLDFDIDGDHIIDAGDRVTVELMLEFKPLVVGNEGMTVSATLDADDIDAEGADDLGSGQLSGSATGETHTLRTEGAVLRVTSTSETLKTNSDSTVADDEGSFVIKFEVTAFESDIFVNKTAASGTTMGTAGVNFLVEDSGGSQVGSGTSTAALASNAKTEGSRFKVAEGETKTFTLTVNYDPATSGFYQVQLYSLNFATSNQNPTTQQQALPESDYETDQISI